VLFLFKPQASIPYRNRDPKPEIPTRGISDVGRELTLIENLSFSNIVMDRIAWEPIHVRLDGDVPDIKAVRNLLFSGIRARGARFPTIVAKESCPVENVKLIGCSFTVTDSEDGKTQNGCWDAYAGYYPVTLHWVKNLRLTDTDFTVEK
jgi:hypothetical protein